MVLSGEGTKRLGADFGKLWASTATANLGDGIALAAGPLLVSGLTSDPAIVSGAAFVQRLPWLLFSLISGAFVDRVDRRALIISVNVCRAAVIGGLAVTIWTGYVTIAIVYAAFFLLGIGETLADNASAAMLPAVVAPDLLPKANARLYALHFVGNMLIAPPVGAAVFVIGAAMPFGINAVMFLLGAAVMATLRYRPPPAEAVDRRPLRQEIGEGLRWLWRHELLRALAVVLCLMNVAFFAPSAILVLYAKEHLSLPEIGFGLLLAVMAVGGLIGTGVAARAQKRFGDGTLLRAGMVIETATHFGLALAGDVWVAGATLLVFGIHASIWGVVAMSVRQRVIPDRLRGRVGSVYFLLVIGGASIGSLAGGLIARQWGVTAPMWVAGAAMIVLTAFAWRHFRREAFVTGVSTG
ncbi:Predicted arabinose efflux permease, MFS family [Actinokineospora alba]|uniref:Predicted arabinose efflux permease, MFS family n=1 Tax=Actinokineospora alba TaxID=504798 RepID=A0A1H0MRK5_9PSEU|nr:MFS transporter [Actinokineospora alba]TDP68401.1 putative MFS family arabinose efflux permease [Actinokineospora alba]SDH78331.1 Predicted arabinose efflux permease, MFS family [Actinokineospora alba]SDO82936.1 Predicted arabinose efflux permease, MFS family [Actinokineospora alba]